MAPAIDASDTRRDFLEVAVHGQERLPKCKLIGHE